MVVALGLVVVGTETNAVVVVLGEVVVGPAAKEEDIVGTQELVAAAKVGLRPVGGVVVVGQGKFVLGVLVLSTGRGEVTKDSVVERLSLG